LERGEDNQLNGRRRNNMMGVDTKAKSVKKENKMSGVRDVEFSFNGPEATKVFVAGELNSWDIQSWPMKRDKTGTWKLKAKLSPGRYEYKFFRDNRWVEELLSGEKVANPFGTQNLVKWVE
jgi:1,4-alpha-glucan branching enzyme